MMVIVANLHLAGFFDWITDVTLARLHPRHLLPTVIFTSGALSAFFVNDIVCLFMTPFVLQIVRRLRLRPVPYLLAVATASNIGSVATITGNPQNMVVGSLSSLSYVEFLRHLGPIAAAGLLIDWGILHVAYLRGGIDRLDVFAAVEAGRPARARPRLKAVVVLMLVFGGFLAGLPPSTTAAVGAALMLITRSVEPRLVYDEIDWGLLVFFVGLFVIVGGAERAGLTASVLEPFLRWNLHNLATFSVVTAFVSNLVSNVPAVLLLKSLVPSFPNPHAGWLGLAMASTLAGNLTITASVANIIVVERAAPDVHIGFREYFKAGLPITVATLVAGLAWLTLVP
jgi:Na+/H+ antiporter NhaD/arsenite permease-like protein